MRGMKRRVTLSLEEDILERIDEEKGLASRSAYIEDILRKALKLRWDKAIAR